MTTTSSPSLKCPGCGFTVFNRRYPKCERCKEPLPEGVSYSSEEVAALRVREDTHELARHAERRPLSPNGDTDLNWGHFGSSGGLPDGDCSSDSDACGSGE